MLLEKKQCVRKSKESSVPPELSVLADGHHDQHVSQDGHQHDQRQEADQGHPLWHAVATETAKRHQLDLQSQATVCIVYRWMQSDGEK